MVFVQTDILFHGLDGETDSWPKYSGFFENTFLCYEKKHTSGTQLK